MADASNSILAARSAQIFSDDGLLPSLVPGYVPNERQMQYAARAAAVFGLPDPETNQGAVMALLEGETGTGKTLGYLVPLLLNAALTGERAIVSTQTNHLARQLLKEDGPLAALAVEKLTGRQVSLARRIGRRNFVDPDRVASVLRAMNEGGSSDRAIADLDAWSDVRPATFAEAADAGLGLPAGIGEADLCLLPSSSNEASEAFHAHVAESRDADILVTNHSLSLINARLWSRILDGVERPARLAVFDEADTLPQVARSMSESKLPLSTLKSLADSLPSGDAYDVLEVALKTLRKAIEPLVGARSTVIDASDAFIPLRSSAAVTQAALLDAADACGDEALKAALAEAAADIRDWLRACGESKFEIAVLTASPVKALPSLVTVSSDPARVLTRLWRRFEGREPYLRAALITSATLAAPTLSASGRGSFSEIMRELGISGGDNYQSALSDVFAPSSFGKMSFMLADRDAPLPTMRDEDGDVSTNPEWLDYAADGILASSGGGGRTLVLATSYLDADELGRRVAGAIVHRRGEKLSKLLALYRADPAAVLITPAAWSGVSLPGLVQNLVIPRIPYAAPDDARNAVQIEAMIRHGRSEAEARGIIAGRAQAEAKRRLRQGIGRGLRVPSDVCRLWILDPRFPLPDALVRNRRLRLYQGAAENNLGLIACIAQRFRVGVAPAFDRAKIFRMWSQERLTA